MNERPNRTEREQRLTKTYQKIMEEDLNKQGVAEPEEVDSPLHGIDWTAIIDSIVEHDGPVRIPEPFTEPFLNDLLEAAVDYACQAKDNKSNTSLKAELEQTRANNKLLREQLQKAEQEAIGRMMENNKTNLQGAAREYRRERALSVAIAELKRIAGIPLTSTIQATSSSAGKQLQVIQVITKDDPVIQAMIDGTSPKIPVWANEPTKATEHGHSTSGSQREAEADYDAWGFGKPFIRPLPGPKLTVDGPLMDFTKGIVGELAPPPAGIGTQGSTGYLIGLLKESLDQLRFAAQATITGDIVKEKAYKIGAAAYLLTVAAEPKKGVNQ